MAAKHHPIPLSGGDRKALKKELSGAAGMAKMLRTRSLELRGRGEAMLQQADNLLCQSWNETMWAFGGPIDPSPTIDQALNGGYPWLQIRCSRCRTPSSIDLAALPHATTTCVHDLVGRLACYKCRKAGKRPSAELQQLTPSSTKT